MLEQTEHMDVVEGENDELRKRVEELENETIKAAE